MGFCPASSRFVYSRFISGMKHQVAVYYIFIFEYWSQLISLFGGAFSFVGLSNISNG